MQVRHHEHAYCLKTTSFSKRLGMQLTLFQMEHYYGLLWIRL